MSPSQQLKSLAWHTLDEITTKYMNNHHPENIIAWRKSKINFASLNSFKRAFNWFRITSCFKSPIPNLEFSNSWCYLPWPWDRVSLQLQASTIGPMQFGPCFLSFGQLISVVIAIQFLDIPICIKLFPILWNMYKTHHFFFFFFESSSYIEFYLNK